MPALRFHSAGSLRSVTRVLRRLHLTSGGFLSSPDCRNRSSICSRSRSAWPLLREVTVMLTPLAFLCFLPDGMLHRLINVPNRGILPSGGCSVAGNAGTEHLIEPVYRILHAVRAAHDADAGIRLIRGVHAGGRHAAQDSHARRPGQRLFPPSAALRRNPESPVRPLCSSRLQGEPCRPPRARRPFPLEYP